MYIQIYLLIYSKYRHFVVFLGKIYTYVCIHTNPLVSLVTPTYGMVEHLLLYGPSHFFSLDLHPPLSVLSIFTGFIL